MPLIALNLAFSCSRALIWLRGQLLYTPLSEKLTKECVNLTFIFSTLASTLARLIRRLLINTRTIFSSNSQGHSSSSDLK